MSNVKRKDNKGRNLRLGESQRKDGRYVYKYTDIYGKLLWSSIFVTPVAKKYRFMQFELDRVFDTR